MKSKLQFFEGVTGSGIVASITYGNSRVIFDFGAPFNPMTQPYDGQVEKREKAWVRDAIRLSQIPAIDGVFSEKDLVSDSEIQPFEKSNLTTGVIISHLHLDHMSGIGMVHPDIPVYLHHDAHKLQTLLDAVGESVGERSNSPVELYVPFYIGEIKITAYFSDHPCAGAVGYLIEPPDGKYYYSGDVRMHGGHLDKVVKDIQKIAKEEVDVLILEATTFSPTMYEKADVERLVPSLDIPEGMTSEGELLERVYQDLADSGDLGIFNIYHRDMELIKGLFNLADRANREIVFEPKTAYIVMQMLGFFPTVFVPDNRVYTAEPASYFRFVLENAPKIVGYDDILAAPEQYFIQNSYENILELFDLADQGARYYHLYGVPLVEGSRSYKNMQRVLQLTGVKYAAFANLYCYNHAYPNNLLYMANEIAARNLIAVHSSSPEKLTCEKSWKVIAQKGEIYQLEDGIVKAKLKCPTLWQS